MSTHSSSLSAGTDRPVRVLKFGGTSVGTVGCLHGTAHVIRESAVSCRPVVVVSAAGGVTDVLAEAADEAPHLPGSAARWTERVAERYRALAEKSLDDETLRTRYGSILCVQQSALQSALQSRQLGPEASAIRDDVLATGERLMAPLLAAVLTEIGCRAQAVDASSLIGTDATHGCAAVDRASTRAQVQNWQAQRTHRVVPVVTGFIGSTAEGVTTTLGRGGSDYSAALLARALEADRLERWTDVDALYTRDPAENDEARRLSHIRMIQARSWTKEGRLGLHPRTLDPLAAAGIPLHVRCIHQPDSPGTRIIPAAVTEATR